jgi:hypothetical protein
VCSAHLGLQVSEARLLTGDLAEQLVASGHGDPGKMRRVSLGFCSAMHLEVLGAAPRRKVEIVVTWQELEPTPQSWPEDWIDSTCGSIDDPTFFRPVQGEFERREPLE